uniref:Secreted protein n=1 Tax=Panagrolaimus superbus TaxID=310955 RepID=A0A914Z0L0_9BILA
MLINFQMYSYSIVCLSIIFALFVDRCSAKVINFEYYPSFNNERPKRETIENFMTKKIQQPQQQNEGSHAMSADELNSEVHYLYRVQQKKSQRSHDLNVDGTPAAAAEDDNNKRRIQRRSISNAVIETARCEHIELLDCEDYENDEMTCMVTATGMPCCICTGKLKSLKLMRKKKWSIW